MADYGASDQDWTYVSSHPSRGRPRKRRDRAGSFWIADRSATTGSSSTERRREMDNGDLVADFADADFVAIGPLPHPTQMAIMPVVAMKGDYVRAVGTCFAISSQGLVLTARHVIENALEIDGEGKIADPDMGIGVLYAAETGEDDKLGGLLPARKLHFTTDLDIALMQLNLPIARATGRPLCMPGLRLGTRIPRVGEQCAGIGYHAMEWQRATGIRTHHVKQKYAASQGCVRELHLNKRDDLLMKFPCFRTDCRFVGGMSGGPRDRVPRWSSSRRDLQQLRYPRRGIPHFLCLSRWNEPPPHPRGDGSRERNNREEIPVRPRERRRGRDRWSIHRAE